MPIEHAMQCPSLAGQQHCQWPCLQVPWFQVSKPTESGLVAQPEPALGSDVVIVRLAKLKSSPSQARSQGQDTGELQPCVLGVTRLQAHWHSTQAPRLLSLSWLAFRAPFKLCIRRVQASGTVLEIGS